MQASECHVSFIIPAKNEEVMLPATIDSIHKSVNNRITYEIIVIDNNSTDETASIAREKGARVIKQNNGTIGSLRNTGAGQARGKYLVFIDADVSITPDWFQPFLDTIKSMQDNPYMITGSRCLTAEAAGWIANSWFRQAPAVRQATHVGSGHMITSKVLFKDLGGFDERLQSAEDFDFCSRAKQSGAMVLENHNLKVIHFGAPDTLAEFFQREIWHGAGDVRTLKTSLQSKVTMMSLLFLIANISVLAGLVIYSATPVLLVISLLVVLTICVASAWRKYYFAPINIVINNVLLFYIYYWGRSVSIINRLIPIMKHSNPRAGRAKG